MTTRTTESTTVLYSGSLIDLQNQAPGDYQSSGTEGFTLTKKSRVVVRLKADDVGYLNICRSGKSIRSLSAALMGEEWKCLRQDDFWQVCESFELEAGSYTLQGSVSNADIGGSTNNSVYLAVCISLGTPGKEKREILVCDPCSCTQAQAGDNSHDLGISLPREKNDFCRIVASLPDTETAATDGSALQLQSIWQWQAVEDAGSVMIFPPACDPLVFDGNGICAAHRNYRLETAENEWVLWERSGVRIHFSADSGSVLSVTDAKGVTYTEGDCITEESVGAIRCVTQKDGIQTISTEADGQLVSERSVNGAATPYLVETLSRSGDSTILTRQLGELPTTQVIRTATPGCVTLTQGDVTTTYLTTDTDDGLQIVEQYRTCAGESSSSIISVTQESAQGRLLLSRSVDGESSRYRYDDSGRLIRIDRADGSYTRYEYDEQDRIVLEAEPSCCGSEHITRTTYADELYWDNRPSSVIESYGDIEISRKTYTYEGLRTTVTHQALGSEYSLTSIEEVNEQGKPLLVRKENGEQTAYEYSDGCEISVTSVAGVPVTALSRREERQLASNDDCLCLTESIWDGSAWQELNRTEYRYDEQHRVIEERAADGRTIHREWMCCGLLSETDADGIRTDYAYDSAGQMTESTRSATATTPETITEYIRDAAGHVTETVRHVGPMKTTETTAYDGQGRITARTDALGNTTYTAREGLTTTVTYPDGSTKISTESADGHVLAESGTGQRCVQHEYSLSEAGFQHITRNADGVLLSEELRDGFGRVSEKRVPTTQTGVMLITRYQYNAFGQITLEQEGETAPIISTYDTAGQLTERSQGSMTLRYSKTLERLGDGLYAVSTTQESTAGGTWLSRCEKTLVSASACLVGKRINTDTRGNESTEWVNYGKGPVRYRRTHSPASAYTVLSVETDGFTTEEADAYGQVTHSERRYTTLGTEQIDTDGYGNRKRTEQDVLGRTICVTDAKGAVTRTQYDCMGRVSCVIDAQGGETHYRYDARGRKTARYGSAVRPVLYRYDDGDRLCACTTFRASGETITEDPSNRTDGDTTTWDYDPATGLLLSMQYPDGKSLFRTYDAANRPLTQTTARGVVQTASYDEATGILTDITFSDDTPAQHFVYNSHRELIRVQDAAGGHELSYTAYGESAAEILRTGDADIALHEHYDTLGRSAGYELAGQQRVRYRYDGSGRLSHVSYLTPLLARERVFHYEYEEYSDVLRFLHHPNGIRLELEYEDRRHLLTHLHYTLPPNSRRAGGVSRDATCYEYDLLGRPVHRNAESFAYNARHELTEVQIGTDSCTFSYDNVGNRVCSTDPFGLHRYENNALNQHTSIDGFAPEWDADGNLVLLRTETGIWRVQYKALNRPTRFEKADGSVVVTAEYDYMGRCVFRKVVVNDSVALHERYLYRGYVQIAAIDLRTPQHPVLRSLIWDPTQPTATRPLALCIGKHDFSYGWDLAKNIRALYNEQGELHSSYSYDVYGKARGGVNNGFAPVAQPLGWGSEVYDAELGLVCYNYRYYEPSSAMWLSRDSASSGENLYAYVDNSPVATFDYLGLLEMRLMTKDINQIFFTERQANYFFAWNFFIDGIHYVNEYVVQKIDFYIEIDYCPCHRFVNESERHYLDARLYWESWSIRRGREGIYPQTSFQRTNKIQYDGISHDYWFFVQKYDKSSSGHVIMSSVVSIFEKRTTGSLNKLWPRDKGEPMAGDLPSTKIQPKWWTAETEQQNESIKNELTIRWNGCREKETRYLRLKQNGETLMQYQK